MRSVVAGTAGHIDHGKTELVRALTGTNPDRLKEEQQRGITIDIGFAHLDLPDVRLAFVDVPGHERFVKNMLAGASGIDLVVLVVAADESIKPQTREHFDICRLLGVARGLVALTKCDLADAELRDIAALEIREFVRGSFLEGAPIVPVSARTGEGLDALREALREAALAVPPRAASGLARLPVDRAFSIRGFGTVITGTLVAGLLREGDEVEVLPARLRGRIRGLEVHNAPVREVHAGQRAAVNLQGLAAGDVARGQVLVPPGSLVPCRMIDAEVRVLPDSPIPLKNLSRVRFHAGTSEILARVRTLEADAVEPGATGPVSLRMESETVLVPHDRFILRRYSPARTIAGGIVLDIAPRKHRRGEAGLIERLKGLATADPLAMARACIAEAGDAGIALVALAARCGIRQADAGALVQRMVERGEARLLAAEGGRVLDGRALDRLAERAVALLAEFHAREPLRPGLPKEELRTRLGGASPEVFRIVLETLGSSGRVRVERDLIALAGHRVELGEEESRARARLEQRLRESGLDPPFVEDLLSESGITRAVGERILHMLGREGKAVRLKDGRYFHAEALAGLRRKLYEFRRRSEMIDVGTFKDLAGVSRKSAIPLLEHLDAEKVTIRKGNDRLILPERV